MLRHHTTAALAACMLLAVTACGSSDAKADPAACKAAMSRDYADAIAAGEQAEQSTRPPACVGIDDETAQRIAGELIAEQIDDQTKDPAQSTEPSAASSAIPPECRAWIEAELRDSTDSIDATAGDGACGDLSGEELDQAIADVTDDLIGKGSTGTP
ncbi:MULTISPECIES: hypothetical protein [unclassified Streptomyces]|uniref:hypothetical protein n=1 Tax=Streptomyces sp. NPDC127129 TaxID=3345373 RepID=UPI00362533C8